MAIKTYREKLLDPRWQKKRLEVLGRDNFECQLCYDSETELHVHHKEYIKGNEPWEYELSNFKTLCKCCHSLAGWAKDANYKAITVCKVPTLSGDIYLFASVKDLHEDKCYCAVCKYEDNGISVFLLLDEQTVFDINCIINPGN